MWGEQVEPLGEIGRAIFFRRARSRQERDAAAVLARRQRARAARRARRALGETIRHGGALVGRHGRDARRALAPDRVLGLALLDTSAAPETMPNRMRYRAMLSTHRRVGLPQWVAERRVLPLYFSDDTLASRRDIAVNFWRDAVGFPREGVYKAGKAIFQRGDFRPELSRVRCSTLVMCGAVDRATPPDRAREIAAGIPGSELVLVEGAGHLSALEQPDRVNASLVPFAKAHLPA